MKYDMIIRRKINNNNNNNKKKKKKKKKKNENKKKKRKGQVRSGQVGSIGDLPVLYAPVPLIIFLSL